MRAAFDRRDAGMRPARLRRVARNPHGCASEVLAIPRRIRLAADAGISLVEATMTVLLLGIVMGTAYQFMWSQSSGIAAADARAQAAADARYVAEIFSREVRQAEPRTGLGTDLPFVEYMDYRSLIFYTDRDGDDIPERVEYYVDDQGGSPTYELRRRVWVAINPVVSSTTTLPAGGDWQYDLPNPSVETALAAEMRTGPARPLFTGAHVDSAGASTYGAAVAEVASCDAVNDDPDGCKFDQVILDLFFEVPDIPNFTYQLALTTAFRNPRD